MPIDVIYIHAGMHTYIYITYILILIHMHIHIHTHNIAGSWRSVANDLKTHPHCEDAFVKKGLQVQMHSEDALEDADAL